MYQLHVIPRMCSAFAKRESVIDGRLLWLHPLFAYSARSPSHLEYLGEGDSVVTVDSEPLSSMTLPETDLTVLVPFPDILEAPIDLATSLTIPVQMVLGSATNIELLWFFDAHASDTSLHFTRFPVTFFFLTIGAGAATRQSGGNSMMPLWNMIDFAHHHKALPTSSR